MPLSESDLRRLLDKGEDQQTEFKGAQTHWRAVARNIGSLANTEGGILLLGVAEPLDGGLLVEGINPQTAQRLVDRATASLDPPPDLQFQIVRVGNSEVAAISVGRAGVTPILSEGVAYMRIQDRNVPATAQQMLRHITTTGASISDGTDQLHRLFEAIELQGKLIESQGLHLEKLRNDSDWKSKLAWTIVGAIIGAVVGLIPFLFFPG